MTKKNEDLTISVGNSSLWYGTEYGWSYLLTVSGRYRHYGYSVEYYQIPDPLVVYQPQTVETGKECISFEVATAKAEQAMLYHHWQTVDRVNGKKPKKKP